MPKHSEGLVKFFLILAGVLGVAAMFVPALLPEPENVEAYNPAQASTPANRAEYADSVRLAERTRINPSWLHADAAMPLFFERSRPTGPPCPPGAATASLKYGEARGRRGDLQQLIQSGCSAIIFYPAGRTIAFVNWQLNPANNRSLGTGKVGYSAWAAGIELMNRYGEEYAITWQKKRNN